MGREEKNKKRVKKGRFQGGSSGETERGEDSKNNTDSVKKTKEKKREKKMGRGREEDLERRTTQEERDKIRKQIK
jgi:hypothetical protein